MLLEVDHSVVVRSYYVRIVDLDFCLPLSASVAQLAEHALRKRMVVGSIPTGGFSCMSRMCQAGVSSQSDAAPKVTEHAALFKASLNDQRRPRLLTGRFPAEPDARSVLGPGAS